LYTVHTINCSLEKKRNSLHQYKTKAQNKSLWTMDICLYHNIHTPDLKKPQI